MQGISLLETGCGQVIEQPFVDDFVTILGVADGAAKLIHLVMDAEEPVIVGKRGFDWRLDGQQKNLTRDVVHTDERASRL